MIKDYKSFMVKEQEDDLFADLSDLGFEKKYSEDMISDAISDLDIEEYVSHIDQSSFSWKIRDMGKYNKMAYASLDCYIEFITTLNADSLWDDLEKRLEKLDLRDYEERHWTLDEVKDAFFDVDWDDEAHQETSTDDIGFYIEKPLSYREGDEIELLAKLDSEPKFGMSSVTAADLIIGNLP
jgi:hypothetical protein